MTSSLVGSEMCIRDSVWEHPAFAIAWGLAFRLPFLGVSFLLGCLPPGPVSYTHLTLPTICSV
eukprot:7835079-Prorocentrum_lima.AAC.1